MGGRLISGPDERVVNLVREASGRVGFPVDDATIPPLVVFVFDVAHMLEQEFAKPIREPAVLPDERRVTAFFLLAEMTAGDPVPVDGFAALVADPPTGGDDTDNTDNTDNTGGTDSTGGTPITEHAISVIAAAGLIDDIDYEPDGTIRALVHPWVWNTAAATFHAGMAARTAELRAEAETAGDEFAATLFDQVRTSSLERSETLFREAFAHATQTGTDEP